MYKINWKKLALILIAYSFLFASLFAQDKKSEPDLQKYVGKYLLDDSGFTKVRFIKLEDGNLYYIAGNTKIPLKSIGENEFSLYPSQTYIEFDFNENGKIKVKITKASGGVIVGERVSKSTE